MHMNVHQIRPVIILTVAMTVHVTLVTKVRLVLEKTSFAKILMSVLLELKRLEVSEFKAAENAGLRKTRAQITQTVQILLVALLVLVSMDTSKN